MSQILMMILSSMNSLMFAWMKHPMNMGMILLTQTLIMCLMTGLMFQTPWFSYILFLVFLGGMLVLFIYMTSIASNEMFKKSNYPLIIFITTMMILTLLLSFTMDHSIIMNSDNENLLFKDSLTSSSNKLILAPLYNNPTSTITIFMVMYLFLTLIVIVSITKFNKGPLRPSN